ncbi:uncharacterized protein LOC120271681 [Dioscorea cayenensis subsp. rotundata]|uniref:Uncharacterized protein LOC120271681 n=1 Tax=Dioscorea cayennensis subsp. rotundata TaxID=55577 RepID=A0AB40C727_DIOCR|nr:uncharacterized protein LOC120271681 [Dioscorea cayenensis subsp. rotundata]
MANLGTSSSSSSQTNIVDKGYDEEEKDEHKLDQNIKRNAKALVIIQQSLDEKVLIIISQTRNAKKAWDILKKEYQGCIKSSVAKLYSYRQEFEIMRMKNGDLSPKFKHVVSSIIKAKDLSTLTVDELSGSLKGHESRLDMETDQVEVKAFHAKGEGSTSNPNVITGRGRGRGGCRGRGRVTEQKEGQGEGRKSKAHIQCYNYKKYGHYKSQCWQKDNSAHDVEEDTKVTQLFLVGNVSDEQVEDVWLLDSGCNNHMIGMKSLFQSLNTTYQQVDRLGDNQMMKVEGMGTERFKIRGGQVKELDRVQFVPEIAHNLLSVGKLVEGGYTLFFDDQVCVIKHKQTDVELARIQKSQHNLFPLSINDVKSAHVAASKPDNSFIWHESSESKGYKLFDPLTGKLQVSREVVFYEEKISN